MVQARTKGRLYKGLQYSFYAPIVYQIYIYFTYPCSTTWQNTPGTVPKDEIAKQINKRSTNVMPYVVRLCLHAIYTSC